MTAEDGERLEEMQSLPWQTCSSTSATGSAISSRMVPMDRQCELGPIYPTTSFLEYED